MRDHPNDAGYLAQAAVVDAALGRKEEALREIQRAVELEQDPLQRSQILSDRAVIYSRVGDRDRALAQLEQLAKMIPGIDYGDLRLNPEWDSLRGDSRFERIVAELQPKQSEAAPASLDDSARTR